MSIAPDEQGPEKTPAPLEPSGTVVYFDGTTSRRRLVTLAFKDQLEIHEQPETTARWPYDDIRRADSPAHTLRVSCLSAPALARLEIRDAAVAAEPPARCPRLDENIPGRHGVGAIIGWSLAAAVSIVAVVLFGVPLAADRLAPLVPPPLEGRLGDVAEGQVKVMYGAKYCTNASGQAAFNKLVDALRAAAGIDSSLQTAVLWAPIPHAFAL